MSVTSLQCAILSMDVYNRNYSEGDNPPPLSLGASEILDDEVSILQEMPVAGSSFYAAAYAVGGTIVIAFRGTDDSDDQSTGWGLGGWPWGVASVPEQARLAAKFVREIRDDPDYAGMDIVLTGHSLGGGLAGFCATLFDLQAHCFNTMSWQDGAEKARADALYADYLEENDEEVPADLADLRARVYGVGEIPPLMPSTEQDDKIIVTTLALEVLAPTRLLGGGIGDAHHDELEIPDSLNLVEGIASAMHMQEQLIIRQSVTFAQESDWLLGGKWVVEKLHDEDFAEESGIAARGSTAADRVMSYQIAYSAGGGTAFGNSAIKALNDDTAGLGEIIRLGGDNLVADLDNQQREWFATAIVEYAALLAEHKVMLSSTEGIMSFDDATSIVTFDFTDATWTFGEEQPDAWHPGFAAVISAAHDMVGLDPEVRYFFEESVGAVSFVLGVGAMEDPWTPPVLPTALDAEENEVLRAALVVGSAFDDEFHTSSDEFALAHYLAGGGHDVIIGNGSGVVFGGEDNDVISNVEWALGEGGDDEFYNVTFASGGSGINTFENCLVSWGGDGYSEFYYETSIDYELMITIINDPFLTDYEFVNSDVLEAIYDAGAYGIYYIVNPSPGDKLFIDGVQFTAGENGVLLTGSHEYEVETPEFPMGYMTEGDVEFYGMYNAGLGWHTYVEDGAMNLHNVLYAIDDYTMQPGFGNVYYDHGTTIIRGLQDGDFGIMVPDTMTPMLKWYDEEGELMDDTSGSNQYAVDDLSLAGSIDVDFSAYSLLA